MKLARAIVTAAGLGWWYCGWRRAVVVDDDEDWVGWDC
jgi:hypothetical protein